MTLFLQQGSNPFKHPKLCTMEEPTHIGVDCGLCGQQMSVELEIARTAVHPFACSDCLEEPPSELLKAEYQDTREEQGYE